MEERDEVSLQAVVDQAPQAHTYYSDGFATYRDLVYDPATYTVMSDTSQTYTVEGGNANLRHYLARLARKSRCFSRSIDALRCAIKPLVWCYNQPQLWNQQYPQHLKQVIEFVSSLL